MNLEIHSGTAIAQEYQGNPTLAASLYLATLARSLFASAYVQKLKRQSVLEGGLADGIFFASLGGGNYVEQGQSYIKLAAESGAIASVQVITGKKGKPLEGHFWYHGLKESERDSEAAFFGVLDIISCLWEYIERKEQT